MTVNELQAGKLYLPLVQQQQKGLPAKNPDDIKFSDTLKEFIDDVDQLQKNSIELTDKFIKGEPVDIHDVMIASEKADTSLKLLMELRNKGLDLYREVLRMQL